MTEVRVDDQLKKEAAELYPAESFETVTQEALKSYLAYAELAKMKGILTKDDVWDTAETR
jgi:hypothetical protein